MAAKLVGARGPCGMKVEVTWAMARRNREDFNHDSNADTRDMNTFSCRMSPLELYNDEIMDLRRIHY
jgi:hypothetical protein